MRNLNNEFAGQLSSFFDVILSNNGKIYITAEFTEAKFDEFAAHGSHIDDLEPSGDLEPDPDQEPDHELF